MYCVWGSENWTSLDFEMSMENPDMLCFHMLFLQNGRHFVKKLKPWRKGRILKGYIQNGIQKSVFMILVFHDFKSPLYNLFVPDK